MAEVTQEQIDNALFHYTTADGLIGIIQSNELWSTAYYCTNDGKELLESNGIFQNIFNSYKPTDEVYKEILEDIKGCIDAVIIGPNSRMDSRKTAVEHLLLANGLKDVEVRASEIPFVRV